MEALRQFSKVGRASPPVSDAEDGRGRPSRLRRGLPAAAKAAFVAASVLCLAGPLAYLAVSGGWSGVAAGLAALSAADRARLAALCASDLRIALGATGLALLCGTLVAVAVERAAGWRRVVLCALYPVPLLLPPVVVAIAWTHILGKRGLAASLWRTLSGEGALPFSIYGEAGSAAVLGLCWFPLVTMPLLVGLRALRGQDRAARVYASPWRAARHVYLPALLPYAAGGAALVAWLALGDFEVPTVFLRDAFTLEIFAALQVQPDPRRALALCLPLLALAALVFAARQALMQRGGAAAASTQWRCDDCPVSRPAARTVVVGAWLVLGLSVAAPLAALAHQAGSLQTAREALETAGPQILHTFRTAALAALLMFGAALPYAALLQSAQGWKRQALAALALLPLAIPGTLHGLAWTALLIDAPGGGVLLGSPYIVSLASAVRFFPLCLFIVLAALDSVDPRLHGPARMAGAGAWLRAWRLTLPLAYPGLAAAFAIGFAFAAGELGASILLSPAGHATLPVRLSSLLHFGKDEMLAALCLVQAFLALAPYLSAALLLRRALEVNFG